LIKLKEEIIGITEELLEENESNITDIKKLDFCCSHNYDSNNETAQQKKQQQKK
jgi:hypothetical protein